MTVRTRFAPSPTGYLHVGGVRTALFSWLHARHHGGKTILRIEDTDLERSTPEAVQAIVDGLAWLGLNHDEGIFYQTQRFPRYKTVIQDLLAAGKAYKCYCTKEEVEQMRLEQQARKEKPRYNGYWRERADAPPAGRENQYVVRFKNPLQGDVIFQDLIKGAMCISNQELDDLIIARSDGTPTYNFCVVVDDWDMGVTHVIRGDDHLNNTPRQINILQALGATIPQYAHVPMILGDDGQKLSKRHGAVSVLQYKEAGFLPQALLNYLVRLGWSHGDQEIFSLQEMIDLFDISAVNSAASAFNTEKLLWLNQQYLRSEPPEALIPHLRYQFELAGINPENGANLVDLIKIQAERVKTLKEMVEVSRLFYVDEIEYDMALVQKQITAAVVTPLICLKNKLAQLPEWRPETIHAAIQAAADENNLKLGKLAQPLRVAITGGLPSPAIDATVYLTGQARSLLRIAKALHLAGHSNE